MSADNWTVCPKCNVITVTEFNKRIASAKRAELVAEGMFPASRYLELKAERERIEDERDEKLGESFREDYYIRVTADGQFVIDYCGSCTVCGFTKMFKHSEILTL